MQEKKRSVNISELHSMSKYTFIWEMVSII